MSTENPIDALCRRVREAIEAYDRTGDHSNHNPSTEPDCIRCQLVAALPAYERPKRIRKQAPLRFTRM